MTMGDNIRMLWVPSTVVFAANSAMDGYMLISAYNGHPPINTQRLSNDSHELVHYIAGYLRFNLTNPIGVHSLLFSFSFFSLFPVHLLSWRYLPIEDNASIRIYKRRFVLLFLSLRLRCRIYVYIYLQRGGAWRLCGC